MTWKVPSCTPRVASQVEQSQTLIALEVPQGLRRRPGGPARVLEGEARRHGDHLDVRHRIAVGGQELPTEVLVAAQGQLVVHPGDARPHPDAVDVGGTGALLAGVDPIGSRSRRPQHEHPLLVRLRRADQVPVLVVEPHVNQLLRTLEAEHLAAEGQATLQHQVDPHGSRALPRDSHHALHLVAGAVPGRDPQLERAVEQATQLAPFGRELVLQEPRALPSVTPLMALPGPLEAPRILPLDPLELGLPALEGNLNLEASVSVSTSAKLAPQVRAYRDARVGHGAPVDVAHATRESVEIERRLDLDQLLDREGRDFFLADRRGLQLLRASIPLLDRRRRRSPLQGDLHSTALVRGQRPTDPGKQPEKEGDEERGQELHGSGAGVRTAVYDLGSASFPPRLRFVAALSPVPPARRPGPAEPCPRPPARAPSAA